MHKDMTVRVAGSCPQCGSVIGITRALAALYSGAWVDYPLDAIKGHRFCMNPDCAWKEHSAAPICRTIGMTTTEDVYFG